MDAGTALSIIFGAVLALFSTFLVGYSLLREHGPELDARDSAVPESDDPALGDIFDAIRTLELEYQLGRMTQEEFQGQFQAYRVQAANVLRDQLDAGRGDPAWVLEYQILLARDAQESANGQIAETAGGKAMESGNEKVLPCPDCSAVVPESAGNCPNCGAEMVAQP